MFKKILACSLLCMLFFNIFGAFPLFRFAQEMIRKEMAENIAGFIPENELDVVITSKDSPEIEWIKEKKEFKYKSEFYDVVKVETIENQLKYFCIKDHKETDLVDFMHYLIKKEREQNKDPLHSTTRKHAKIWYFESEFSHALKPEISKIKLPFYNYQEKFMFDFYLDKLTPPPQFFS